MKLPNWINEIVSHLWGPKAPTHPLVTAALALGMDPSKVLFSDDPDVEAKSVAIRFWLSDGTNKSIDTHMSEDELFAVGSLYSLFRPVFPNYRGHRWFNTNGSDD